MVIGWDLLQTKLTTIVIGITAGTSTSQENVMHGSQIAVSAGYAAYQPVPQIYPRFSYEGISPFRDTRLAARPSAVKTVNARHADHSRPSADIMSATIAGLL